MYLRLASAFIAPWLLSACFSHTAASSGAVGCPIPDIEIRDAELTPGPAGPTRNWTAICRDREYLCSSVGNGSAACTRVAPEVEAPVAGARGEHWVERGLDEAQGTPTVRAHVRLGVRRSLELLARPTTRQDVTVKVILLKQRGVSCTDMRWTLNAMPQPSVPVTVSDLGPTYRLEAIMPRDVVAQLGRPQPSLSIEGCGQEVSLDAGALAALSEFADVYADIAASVAVTPLPAPTQLTCEARSPTALYVQWQNPDSRAGGVELEHSEQEGMRHSSVMDLPRSESLLDGLLPGTQYVVRVRLRQADEHGPWVETACGTLEVEPPAHAAPAPQRFNTTLRAVCHVSTRMLCGRDNPCCNTCLSVRWESIEPALRADSSGAPYRFVGEPLPQCRWAPGHCGCAFELKAEGELVGTDLVMHKVERVPHPTH